MAFSAGDRVHVPGLGTGVILEVRNHGRCLVEIKGRAIEVGATQLAPTSPKRGSAPTREGGKRGSAPTREGGKRGSAPTREGGKRGSAPTREGGKGDAVSSGGSDASRPASRHAPASLDLHGLTVDQAVEALDAFLNDALLAGHAEVRVIHGRSGGRVKSATHARLRALTVVRAFRVDERNAGVTIVTL